MQGHRSPTPQTTPSMVYRDCHRISVVTLHLIVVFMFTLVMDGSVADASLLPWNHTNTTSSTFSQSKTSSVSWSSSVSLTGSCKSQSASASLSSSISRSRTARRRSKSISSSSTLSRERSGSSSHSNMRSASIRGSLSSVSQSRTLSVSHSISRGSLSLSVTRSSKSLSRSTISHSGSMPSIGGTASRSTTFASWSESTSPSVSLSVSLSVSVTLSPSTSGNASTSFSKTASQSLLTKSSETNSMSWTRYPTNSNVTKGTITPSSSFTNSRTRSESVSKPSHSPSTTSPLSATRTATASMSRQSASQEASASKSMTPTNTVSMSRSASTSVTGSTSASITMSASRSRSASTVASFTSSRRTNTASPTKTTSTSTTPSRTRSVSSTLSNSDSPPRSRTSTVTRSRTASRDTPSLSVSPTSLVTPTRVNSRSNSSTVTVSGALSVTRSATTSPTPSVSLSQTFSHTNSSTLSLGSRTVSFTGSVSLTVSVSLSSTISYDRPSVTGSSTQSLSLTKSHPSVSLSVSTTPVLLLTPTLTKSVSTTNSFSLSTSKSLSLSSSASRTVRTNTPSATQSISLSITPSRGSLTLSQSPQRSHSKSLTTSVTTSLSSSTSQSLTPSPSLSRELSDTAGTLSMSITPPPTGSSVKTRSTSVSLSMSQSLSLSISVSDSQPFATASRSATPSSSFTQSKSVGTLSPTDSWMASRSLSSSQTGSASLTPSATNEPSPSDSVSLSLTPTASTTLSSSQETSLSRSGTPSSSPSLSAESSASRSQTLSLSKFSPTKDTSTSNSLTPSPSLSRELSDTAGTLSMSITPPPTGSSVRTRSTSVSLSMSQSLSLSVTVSDSQLFASTSRSATPSSSFTQSKSVGTLSPTDSWMMSRSVTFSSTGSASLTRSATEEASLSDSVSSSATPTASTTLTVSQEASLSRSGTPSSSPSLSADGNSASRSQTLSLSKFSPTKDTSASKSLTTTTSLSQTLSQSATQSFSTELSSSVRSQSSTASSSYTYSISKTSITAQLLPTKSVRISQTASTLPSMTSTPSLSLSPATDSHLLSASNSQSATTTASLSSTLSPSPSDTLVGSTTKSLTPTMSPSLTVTISDVGSHTDTRGSRSGTRSILVSGTAQLGPSVTKELTPTNSPTRTHSVSKTTSLSPSTSLSMSSSRSPLTGTQIASVTIHSMSLSPSPSVSKELSFTVSSSVSVSMSLSPSSTTSKSASMSSSQTSSITLSITLSDSISTSSSQTSSRTPSISAPVSVSHSVGTPTSSATPSSTLSISQTSSSTVSTTFSLSLSSSMSPTTEASPSLRSVTPSHTQTVSSSLSLSQTFSISPSFSFSSEVSSSLRSVSVTLTSSLSLSISSSLTHSISMILSPTRQSASMSQTETSTLSLSATSSWSVSASPSISSSTSQTMSQTDEHSRSRSASLSTSVTRTLSLSASNSLSQSASSSISQSTTVSSSPSFSGTDELSLSSSTTLSLSGSITTTSTGSASRTASQSSSGSITVSATTSVSSSVTISPSVTRSPSSTSSASLSKSSSRTKSSSETITSSLSLQRSSTLLPTESSSNQQSITASSSWSQSMSVTPTLSAHISETVSETPTSSKSPSGTGGSPTEELSSSPTQSKSPSVSSSETIEISSTTTSTMTLTFSQSTSYTLTRTGGTASPSVSDMMSDTITETETKTKSNSATVSLLPRTSSHVPTSTFSEAFLNCNSTNCGNGYCGLIGDSSVYGRCVCYRSPTQGFWTGGADGGPCSLCYSGYFGPSCTLQCAGGACSACNGNGVCNDGTSGDGSCTCSRNVADGFWDGVSCSLCASGYYGLSCNQACICTQYGTCDEGRFGTGSCGCATGWNGTACEFCIPSIIPTCTNLVPCPGTDANCSGNGLCVRIPHTLTGNCTCFPTYGGPACNTKCPSTALGGLCNGEGVCHDGADRVGGAVCECLPRRSGADCASCLFGYYGSGCGAICPGGIETPCTLRGVCDRYSGLCTCNSGWGGPQCDILCPVAIIDGRSYVCGGKGTCSPINGLCDCNQDASSGYWNGTACTVCSTFPREYAGVNCTIACPNSLLTPEAVSCSGRGICDAVSGACNCVNSCGTACEVAFVNGACPTCAAGFYGSDCSNRCTCSHGAACDSGAAGTGYCFCSGTGYAGPTCDIPCQGGVETPCSNNGTCSPVTGECSCFVGYAGVTCNISCPHPTCHGNGVCHGGSDGNGTCSCYDGYVWPEDGCAYACNCSGHGTCISPSLTCSCSTSNFTGANCEQCADGWYGPLCQDPCSSSGGNTVGQECICLPGWGSDGCSVQCPTTQTHGICNGQGTCGAHGLCTCANAYYGPSCNCTSSICTANIALSTCNTLTGVCECQSRRTGANCLLCETGYFGSNCGTQCGCNNHGGCDQSTGACVCFTDQVNGFWSGATCSLCADGYLGVGCNEISNAIGRASDLLFRQGSTVRTLRHLHLFNHTLYSVGGQMNATFSVTNTSQQSASVAVSQVVFIPPVPFCGEIVLFHVLKQGNLSVAGDYDNNDAIVDRYVDESLPYRNAGIIPANTENYRYALMVLTGNALLCSGTDAGRSIAFLSRLHPENNTVVTSEPLLHVATALVHDLYGGTLINDVDQTAYDPRTAVLCVIPVASLVLCCTQLATGSSSSPHLVANLSTLLNYNTIGPMKYSPFLSRPAQTVDTRGIPSVWTSGVDGTSASACSIRRTLMAYTEVAGTVFVSQPLTFVDDLLAEGEGDCISILCLEEIHDTVFVMYQTVSLTILTGYNLSSQLKYLPVVLGTSGQTCGGITYDVSSGIGLVGLSALVIKFSVNNIEGGVLTNTSAAPQLSTYGQRSLDSSAQLTPPFVIDDDLGVVYAGYQSETGVRILRFLLLETNSLTPTIATRAGDTLLTLTGRGLQRVWGRRNATSFSPSSPVGLTMEMKCQIGDVTVPALFLRRSTSASLTRANPSNITVVCVTTEIESSLVCVPQYVELSIDGIFFTENQNTLQRPREPQLVAASPSFSLVRTASVITISGRSITDSPFVTCLFYDINLFPNGTSRKAVSSDSTITTSSITSTNTTSLMSSLATAFYLISAPAVAVDLVQSTFLCHAPNISFPTTTGGLLVMSLDAQMYSSNTLPFLVYGDAVGFVFETSSTSMAYSVVSSPNASLAPLLTLYITDGQNNRLLALDALSNRTAQIVGIPSSITLESSSQRNGTTTNNASFLSAQCTLGVCVFSHLMVRSPTVGTYSFNVTVGSWTVGANVTSSLNTTASSGQSGQRQTAMTLDASTTTSSDSTSSSQVIMVYSTWAVKSFDIVVVAGDIVAISVVSPPYLVLTFTSTSDLGITTTVTMNVVYPYAPAPNPTVVAAQDSAGNLIVAVSGDSVNAELIQLVSGQSITTTSPVLNMSAVQSLGDASFSSNGYATVASSLTPALGYLYLIRFTLDGVVTTGSSSGGGTQQQTSGSSIYKDTEVFAVQCTTTDEFQVKDELTCRPCDTATAFCNGTEYYSAKPGYWRAPTSIVIYPCTIASACASGGSRCSVGTTGIGCSVCSDGWAQLYNGECAQCPSKVLSIVLIVCAIVILLVSVALITILVTQYSNRTKNRIGNAVVCLIILLSYLQLLVMLDSLAYLNLPDNVNEVLGAVGMVVSFRVYRMQAVQCLLRSFGLKQVHMFLVYVVFLIVVTPFIALIAHVILRKWPGALMLSKHVLQRRKKYWKVMAFDAFLAGKLNDKTGREAFKRQRRIMKMDENGDNGTTNNNNQDRREGLASRGRDNAMNSEFSDSASGVAATSSNILPSSSQRPPPGKKLSPVSAPLTPLDQSRRSAATSRYARRTSQSLASEMDGATSGGGASDSERRRRVGGGDDPLNGSVSISMSKPPEDRANGTRSKKSSQPPADAEPDDDPDAALLLYFKGHQRKALLLTSFQTLLFLLFVTVAGLTLQVFDCVGYDVGLDVGVTQVMRSDTEVECAGDSYQRLRILAGLAQGVYIIFVPLVALFYALLGARIYGEDSFRAYTAFLTFGLRDKSVFWSSFCFLRIAILIAALTFLEDRSAANIYMWLATLFLVAQRKLRPWTVHVHGQLEFAAQSFVIILSNLAVLFAHLDEDTQATARTTLGYFVIVVGMIIPTVLIWNMVSFAVHIAYRRRRRDAMQDPEDPLHPVPVSAKRAREIKDRMDDILVTSSEEEENINERRRVESLKKRKNAKKDRLRKLQDVQDERTRLKWKGIASRFLNDEPQPEEEPVLYDDYDDAPKKENDEEDEDERKIKLDQNEDGYDAYASRLQNDGLSIAALADQRMEAESALRRGNNNNTAGGGENDGMNGGGANQSNKITVWDIRNETQELRDRATARKIGAKWIKGSRGAATDGKDAMEVLRYLEDDTASLNTSANHYDDTSLPIASSSSEDSDGVLRGNARRSNRRRNKASHNNLGGDASPPPALVKVPRAAKRRGGGSHVDDDDGHDDKDTKSVVSSATVRLIRHMEREELEGDIDDFIVQNGPSGQMSLRSGGATSPSAGGAKQRSLVSSLKAQQRPVNLTELMRLHISSRANEHPNGDTTVGQQGDEGQHWAPLGSSTTENDMLVVVVEGASSAAAFFSSSSSSSSDDPFSESTKEKRHHLSSSARRFGKFALRQNALLQGTEGAGDQNEQSLATSKRSSTPSSSSMSSLDFSPPLMNREELLGLRTDVGLSDRADISFLIGAEEAARGEEYQGLSEDAVAELDAIKRRRALEEVEAAQRIEALQRQLFVDAHNERAVRVMKDAGAPIMEASQRPGDGKVSDAFIKKPRMGLRSRGGGGDGRLDPFGTNNRGGGGAIRPPGL